MKPFQGWGSLISGPGLHAPDVGGHEEHDDGPFPPAEDPVHVHGAGDAAPPGDPQGVRFPEDHPVDQAPERHDQDGVVEHGQHAAPADFGQAGLGLFQVAGPDGPFAEQDGGVRIAEEADQDEADHRPFAKVGRGVDQGRERQGSRRRPSGITVLPAAANHSRFDSLRKLKPIPRMR